MTSGFDLLAPDGSVVAVAHVVGKVVTFTLTNYADTHNDVHGRRSSRSSGTQQNLPTTGPVNLDLHHLDHCLPRHGDQRPARARSTAPSPARSVTGSTRTCTTGRGRARLDH